jgi:hypothetical protein
MRTAFLIPLCTMLIAGCSPKPPAASATASSPPPFHNVADVKQLMNWIIEPNADVLWDSVGTIITEAGREELLPETEEEWEAVRNSAAVIAESGNLLMMDGRAFDRDQWMKAARNMINAATTAIQAAEAKDVPALFDAGGAVYEACTACHSRYALGLQRTDGEPLTPEEAVGG